jgi:hypothetical protein
LTGRINPTSPTSKTRALDDLVWNEIVEKVKKGQSIKDVKKLKSVSGRSAPRSNQCFSRQHHRVAAKTVSTMEGKRIKRKIVTLTQQKQEE